jgi:SNF2 family DNA or RNA helicase
LLVYRLVAAGRIEERRLARQARKGALADAVLDSGGATPGPALQVADVHALLVPLNGEDG